MIIRFRFDTREPAPLSVRWARVVVPLFLCFAYLTLRLAPAVHERIALGELLASGVLFVGFTFVAFIALGDLIDPAPLPPRLEDDGCPTEAISAVDAGAISGVLDIDEPELLTHEYEPLHHTPARGIPAIVSAPTPRTGGRHRRV